jgi:hypothetical protein
MLSTNHEGSLRLRTEHGRYPAVTTPSFTLGMNELLTLRVTLANTPLLAPLAVVSRERGEDVIPQSASGFDARERRAVGGHFFSRERLRAPGTTDLFSTLASVDGVIIEGDSAERTVRFRRSVLGVPTGACEPAFFLDAVPVRGERTGVLNRFPLSDIHGIELYLQASQVPGEFRDDAGECGAVLVWTTRTPPGPGRAPPRD